MQPEATDCGHRRPPACHHHYRDAEARSEVPDVRVEVHGSTVGEEAHDGKEEHPHHGEGRQAGVPTQAREANEEQPPSLCEEDDEQDGHQVFEPSCGSIRKSLWRGHPAVDQRPDAEGEERTQRGQSYPTLVKATRTAGTTSSTPGSLHQTARNDKAAKRPHARSSSAMSAHGTMAISGRSSLWPEEPAP